MMLVLIATTSVVPVMASPNTTTVNVHYVVADTSLKNFYTNPDNYFEGSNIAEEINQVVKCQNKWEQEFLYPNIKNGTISIYEPEEYIKKKAKESKYNISQETVDKLIAKTKSYNYSFTTPYGKKFAYEERTYGGSHQYSDGYKDGEAWNFKDNFTIIGSLVDDYDNALTYLIHQQGHTVQDVLANHLDCCLSDEQISKSGFIKGVCTDIEENSSEAMSELGVYIELSGDEIPEFCEKLSDKNAYFVFDKDVNISLFNEWSGTCGYPDNYLERDFVVPTTMVRNVQIEGVRPITRKRADELRNIYKNTDSEYAKQKAGQDLETEGVLGYTIDNVCGMVGDFWKSNSVSYTDTAPTLVNENIETTLNEIEQTIEEKNKCEEIER